MSDNALGLRELTLKFSEPSEAGVDLLVMGHQLSLRVGLDGVERFSPNRLVDLPAASKGRWLGDDTFLLQINFVGAINFYTLRLTFSDLGGNVEVQLSERTGLNEERFTGRISSN
jgi:hypothetical protein